MALSKAPLVKRALYDLLNTSEWPANSTVKVWHSTANVDHNHHENVTVGPSDIPVDVRQEWHTIGAGATRREDIAVPVRVEVWRGGTDEFAAEARAWELAERVDTIIGADNPYLDDLLVERPITEDLSQTTEPFGDGRWARVTMTVRCTAYVS